MLDALTLDAPAERQRIAAFIREQMASTPLSHAVIGLSGGLDSSLTAALCVDALGVDKVIAMLLPYRTSNPESEAHGRMVAEWLGVRTERFEITDMVRPLLEARPDISPQRLGNVMARCRMIVLFDESAASDGLVVGTSNRTEWLLGYFTLGGDNAAALEPIGHLYKCQVRQLAAHMGVPEPIIAKAPSADLWPGQTDEGELGFTYDHADAVLYLLTECGMAPEEIAVQLDLKLAVVQAVERQMGATAFKRRLPPFISNEQRCGIMQETS
jgi:NAD+ synthase